MTTLISIVCIGFVGVLMLVAWACCVVGGRDDDRAGRDYIE